MNNFKQYAIIGALLIIAVSIYVYGGIYKTNQQKELQLKKIQWEAGQITIKKKMYDDCVTSAYSSLNMAWEGLCKIYNYPENCTLMKYQREDIENVWQKELNRCVQLYK